ncbi:hypothetical protein LCGC14_1550190 [marine sediment metagenome]|uniref:Uncharacterized protein n=1 Tax=marine sediment metagenome TaxID=412755 RepID=A0A0F9JBI8_9ZZZZ
MYSKYHQAIKEEMEEFAKDSKVMFIGQQVKSEDFYNTLKDVSVSKRTEMPVAEELQMGLSIGLALEGFLPISIYQRMDFLPRACDQLVNHLDLIPFLSRGKFHPKIIIRSTIGTNKPFDVGLQHNKDLIEGFKALLKTIPIYDVKTEEDVKIAYNIARTQDTSIIIIERQELYYE